MELALLVYAISLLEPIRVFAVIAMLLPAVLVVVPLVFTYNGDAAEYLRPLWVRMIVIPLFVLGVLTNVFLPREKTAYMMVGAYAAQRVYENPTTERLSNKVIQSIEGKLDFYVEEAEKEAVKKLKETTNGK